MTIENKRQLADAILKKLDVVNFFYDGEDGKYPATFKNFLDCLEHREAKGWEDFIKGIKNYVYIDIDDDTIIVAKKQKIKKRRK